MAVNHTTLQARMVADPELKSTNSDTVILNFRVAWSERRGQKETKLFQECKAFNQKAEFISANFHKGKEINVEGQLVTEEWKTQDGQKRSRNVLYIEKVHFGGGKASETERNTDAASAAEPQAVPMSEEELPF